MAEKDRRLLHVVLFDEADGSLRLRYVRDSESGRDRSVLPSPEKLPECLLHLRGVEIAHYGDDGLLGAEELVVEPEEVNPLESFHVRVFKLARVGGVCPVNQFHELSSGEAVDVVVPS